MLRNFETNIERRRAWLTFEVVPGHKSWIGRITIPPPVPAGAGTTPRIDPARVRGVLGLRAELYSETNLEGVKRGLFLTEAFRFVGVTLDSASLVDDADSLVTVNVALAESQLLATRLSAGWGNLDCMRAQVNHTNYNFMRALRRLDVNLRLSKLGVAAPFDGASDLCTSELRNDPLSDTLNYYAGATVSQAALFGSRLVPSVSVYSERRSEFQAYLRATPIGIIGSAQLGAGGPLPMTWSYQLEYGRTVAQPAFFCAVFSGARKPGAGLSAIPAAPSPVERHPQPGGQPGEPDPGSVVRMDLRHASPLVGSDADVAFNRATLDAAWYRPALSGAMVFRVRAGTVLGSRVGVSGSPNFIPLQERLYAGGPNSVRGYRQNELGPAIYIPVGYEEVPIPGNDTLVYFRTDPSKFGERRVVPTGGDNSIVANAELRLRSFAFPELVQWALFVDAGQVWNRGRSGTGVDFGQVRVTPGVGVRVFSPVGPIRMDIGYNPYPRPSGPAYLTPAFSGITSERLNLICVSPGNTLRVRRAVGDQPARQIDEGDCPATYLPQRGASFWNRLTFQFSIGQPF